MSLHRWYDDHERQLRVGNSSALGTGAIAIDTNNHSVTFASGLAASNVVAATLLGVGQLRRRAATRRGASPAPADFFGSNRKPVRTLHMRAMESLAAQWRWSHSTASTP